MDADRFDRLSKTLFASGSRRTLLHLLSAVPLAGALAAILGDESVAKDRRRRRKTRHRQRHERSQDRRRQQQRRKQHKGKGKDRPRCAKVGKAAKKGTPCCKGLSPDVTGRCVAGCTPGSCPANACGSQPDGCGGTLTCGCTGNAICVSGACRACDVCANGCAFSSVRAAINAANNAPTAGGTIHICPGTYQDSDSLEMSILKSVTLIGAGDGLDGTILQRAPFPQRRVLQIDQSATVGLQGLRLTGGVSPSGGGLINGGTTTMTNCTVIGNLAQVGGGIYHEIGSLTLIGCTVRENDANFDGGGIHNAGGGMVTLDATTVTLNRANLLDGGASGGGIFEASGTVILQNGSSVTDNTPDNCAPPGSVPGCAG
jgi:hypothetical protein